MWCLSFLLPFLRFFDIKRDGFNIRFKRKENAIQEASNQLSSITKMLEDMRNIDTTITKNPSKPPKNIRRRKLDL